MFSLKSPNQGHSNEYTQFTIFNIKNRTKLFKSAAMEFFLKELKKEFETAVVNEPPVFEPLKFYCNYVSLSKINIFKMVPELHVSQF